MSEPSECHFIAVRTVTGQEYNVAMIIKSRIDAMKNATQSPNFRVPSVVVMPDMPSIVLIETEFPYLATALSQGIKHARGIIKGKVSLSDLTRSFEKEVEVNVGDVVEVVSGPFKGFKAKVIDVNKKAGTARLEVVDASSLVPITISLQHIRKLPSSQP